MAAIKRDKFDILFSNIIREASDYVCSRCQRGYRDNPSGLHCSHYVGRAHKATRWHPDNAVAHCYGCHSYFEQRPNEFYRWYCQKFGEGREQIITDLGRSIRKWKKWEKDELYEAMKREMKRLRELRASGVVGPVEIANYC